MKWPATRDELRNDGYGFERYTACRSMNCRKNIEMWRTPTGKLMPMSPTDAEHLQPHFADCVDAAKFRKTQR
jgi:hypothetical protein